MIDHPKRKAIHVAAPVTSYTFPSLLLQVVVWLADHFFLEILLTACTDHTLPRVVFPVAHKYFLLSQVPLSSYRQIPYHGMLLITLHHTRQTLYWQFSQGPPVYKE